jgi:hypothetical protein
MANLRGIELLMALNEAGLRPGELPPLPDGARPLPLGPLQPPNTPTYTFNPEPDSPPVAPMPAQDTGFINSYAGERPTAPVRREPGLLEKIAVILGGFGAGYNGQGAQYVQQIREERDAPIRRYEQSLREYENRRTQAIEIDERRRDRQQARTQDAAEAQAQREFQEYIRRSGITDKMTLMELEQQYELGRIRERERVAEEKLTLQQREINDRQARAYKFQLIRDDDAPANIAEEISQHIFNGKPLSKAAENWRAPKVAKLQAQLARLNGRGTGGGTGGASAAVDKTLAEFETLKNIAIQSVKAKGGSVQDEVEAVRKATAAIVRRMASKPTLYEVGVGTGGYLYAKSRQGGQMSSAPAPGQQPQGQMYFDLRGGGPSVGPGALQQQAQAQGGPTDAEVQAYAQRFKLSPDQARKELMGQ